jgi:hypothetical protein
VLPRAPRFNPIPDRFLIELDRRSVDPFYYERIRKLKASWPTIALDGLEFTPKTVITALTSYYRYVLTPKGTKIGVSKWYSAEVQYESIPETQWPVRSWWKPNLSKVQKQLVHSLQQMLEEKDPQPLFWSWSVSRISLKKDEMRVVFKKTPRDVCQPKEAYSRAVLAPSPGTPGPLAAPPPQLPEARPTEYTSKQHFILLPKSVSGSEIVDLRAKWVKCNG